MASMSTGALGGLAVGDKRWTERTTMSFWADRLGTHVKEAGLSQRPDVWKTMAELS